MHAPLLALPTALASAALAAALLAPAAPAQPAPAQPAPETPRVTMTPDGRIRADDLEFATWGEYFRSEWFRENGRRCGTVVTAEAADGGVAGGSGADCSFASTNPAPIYDPSVVSYLIPVVVHVIRQDDGVTGNLSEAQVQSGIDILNEDFLALPGTNGAPGTDVQIQFQLVEITYSNNTTWFNDSGSYWDALAWDTNEYMNVYTNLASGALGYVPDLPQGGLAGSNADRVVVLWSAFGRDAPGGPPYDQGRTLTHEVGHYLGLYHTFQSGSCTGTAPGCYTSGDRVCDTEPESSSTFGCSDAMKCGDPDPIHNYMDYTEDLCMYEFTPEQARRMRCSLEHYRPLLYDLGGDPTGACCDGASCTQLTAADCLASGGSYLGDFTSCAGSPCAGACCQGTSCSVLTEDDCLAAGGVYQGGNTTCDPDPCTDVTGACCTGTSCSLATEFACLAGGGLYLGDATTCAGEPCVTTGDDCAGAVAISGTGSFPFDTVDATTDGLSHTGCGQSYNDVWFRWTAGADAFVRVETCGGASFDTKLAVYDYVPGTCPPGDALLLDCNDDDCGLQSGVEFAATAGAEYLVRIGAYLTTGQGTGSFTISESVPSPDDCTGAAPIGDGLVAFDTTSAGTDGPAHGDAVCAEFIFGGDQVNNDVWFDYTASCTGDLLVTTCEDLGGSATFDTRLAVYSGWDCPVTDARLLGCDDDDEAYSCGSAGGGYKSTVVVPVTAGGQYKIRVGGFGTTSDGTGQLLVSCTPCASCPNGIPADTNADGLVDVDDLLNVLLDWGTDGAAHGGDVTQDGFVDVDDLIMVLVAM